MPVDRATVTTGIRSVWEHLRFDFAWLLPVMLITMLLSQAGSNQVQAQTVPPDDGPVKVSITVSINKIYNIDTIAETYVIDGYINVGWRDPRLALRKPGQPETLIYFNDQVTQRLGSEIWWPMLEFINIIGVRSVLSRDIEIEPNGRVNYSERFSGTFASDMDFRKYPFDTQTFEIKLESFSYGDQKVVLASDKAISDQTLHEEWTFEKPKAVIGTHTYPAFTEKYSSYRMEMTGKRKHDYFLWQFFFPLFMIIISSWIIFWITDFGDQLSTAFTLMLTVVAFNFYVSTLLPRLPYNTFIEISIISGYLTISLTIFVIVVHHQVVERGYEFAAQRIAVASRWVFPLGYVVSMILAQKIFLG